MADEVAAWLRRAPRHPGRSGASAEDILLGCREEIGRLIKASDPRRIVLCSGATAAANLAFYGLGLGVARGLVLTTAMEHNSILRPLYRYAEGGRLGLEIAPCDEEGRVREDAWRDAIERKAPRWAVLNHASNVTGAVNDAAGLLGFARERGCVTFLDASQTIGGLAMNMDDLNADIMIFTGHKNLGGPAGTGGLYVKEGLCLEPLIVGGTGIRSEMRTMPEEMPDRLEAGTPAESLFAGLCFSLRWQADHPFDPQSADRTTCRLEEGLSRLGARVISVRGPRLGIVSFRLPRWSVEEAGYVLDRSFGILCRTGLHCAPLVHRWLGTASEGTIRFSISRFTTEEEAERALEAVGTMLHEHPVC
jgi:selenocysteine lyase/cysteine desulfurase